MHARQEDDAGGCSGDAVDPQATHWRFHMIDSSNLASLQHTETQGLANGPFLEMLRAQGQEHALGWLSDHADSVGRRSSTEVRQWSA